MIPLRPSQQQIVAFANQRPATLISAGLGIGKTYCATYLSDEWDAMRTLVVCPSSVRSVWNGQITKHARRDVEAVILEDGSVRERTDQADAAWSSSRPTFTVANYEACKLEPLRSWILDRRWDCTVLDESHRCSPTSATGKFCYELGRVSDRRLCTSGTPMTQSPVSVFGQCRFLDPTIFGDDFDAFRRRYENDATACRKAYARMNHTAHKYEAELRAAGVKWTWGEDMQPPERLVCGTKNTEEFLTKLAKIAIRVESTVLDLPPLTVERRTFRLSSTARVYYNAIQNGYLGYIETGRWPDVKGTYAVNMRLQQITSGWLPDRGGNPVAVDSGKVECLRDILVGAGGEPVVVFCRFSHDLEIVAALARKLNLTYAEVSGNRKDGLTDKGLMTPGVKCLGVQEQAGGCGIDLTLARIAVRYSPSWSATNFNQVGGRVYRPPQDKPVVIYELVCEDSVDEEIGWAIDARQATIRSSWSGLETARR